LPATYLNWVECHIDLGDQVEPVDNLNESIRGRWYRNLDVAVSVDGQIAYHDVPRHVLEGGQVPNVDGPADRLDRREVRNLDLTRLRGSRSGGRAIGVEGLPLDGCDGQEREGGDGEKDDAEDKDFPHDVSPKKGC